MMRVLTLWLLLIPILVLLACAHTPDPPVAPRMSPIETLPAASVGETVELRLNAQPGRSERVKYVSRTVSESFERGQARYSEEKTADFTVKTDIVRADPAAGRVVQVLETVQKQGDLDLSALALPDVGERLELTLTLSGEVLRAGGYPKETLFYLPPVSLPKDPVSVGETWTLSADWFSLEDGTPFTLDMVSILKGFVTCGSDQCADIEISGEVRLPGEVGRLVGFQSQMSGRLLFAKNQGAVVWGRIDSLETLRAENSTRKVRSCLESVMIEPAEASPKIQPSCADAAFSPSVQPK